MPETPTPTSSPIDVGVLFKLTELFASLAPGAHPTQVVGMWKDLADSGRIPAPTVAALKEGARQYWSARRFGPFSRDYPAGIREMMVILVRAHGLSLAAASVVVDHAIDTESD